VLWLYEVNPLMKTNFAREAEARGIAPERLMLPRHCPPSIAPAMT
jgi:hypothetical protein